MQSFRTIELSDRQFEHNGLRFITVKTKNLKGRGDICLFVPKVAEHTKDLPIYILLHGVYGSAWVWSMKGGAHQTAQQLMDDGAIAPAIIAMPSDGLWADGSGYLSHQEKDFEQWIVSDVPLAIKENLDCAGNKSTLCIGGLSMGGYGALMLGSRFPQHFKAISGHSSITKFEQMSSFVEEPLDSYKIVSPEINVIDSIRNDKKKIPALRFDCGLKDDLLEANRTLHRELQDLGIAHIYEEFDGGHEWSYWQKHLERSLRFFDQYSKE